MQTYRKNRIEIIIEQALVPRLTELLDAEEGVRGFTVVPVHAGRGSQGLWSRDGQISDADGMFVVMCIIDTQFKDAVLEAVFPFVERRAGFVTISEVDVVRSERF